MSSNNQYEVERLESELRRIEAEQLQKTQSLSDVLQRNGVVGFSTYGEQIGPLHVNHTMSGVAFYHPSTGTKAGSRVAD